MLKHNTAKFLLLLYFFFFFLPELFIEFNLSIQPRQYFYQINECLSSLKAQSKP